MHTLLAPSARVRILMPRGYTEYDGADKLLALLHEFSDKWSFVSVDQLDVEVLAPNLMQTGRLVAVSQRLRLRSAAGDRSGTIVMKHLLAIKDGVIAIVDELCTGVMSDT